MQFHGFTFNFCLIMQSFSRSQICCWWNVTILLEDSWTNSRAESIIMQLKMKCHITPKSPSLIIHVMRKYWIIFRPLFSWSLFTIAGLESPTISSFISPHSWWTGCVNLLYLLIYFSGYNLSMEAEVSVAAWEQDVKAEHLASASQTSCADFKRVWGKLPQISSISNSQHC